MGWYIRPRNFEGKLPGMLCVPGYAGEPRFPTDLALQGYAAFSAAPRGKLRSNSVFNPGYPGLLVHNILGPRHLRISRLLHGCREGVRFPGRTG